MNKSMAVYINGTGNISPQKTWGGNVLLGKPDRYPDSKLSAIEPDYDLFIDPRQSRRMSRVIKMGIASAVMALDDAEVKLPDAIITGTGYGCLEDTGAFLSKMITNQEQALNPTPFIQSTHNTIGSQIALLLQCQAYNQTYTHGGFSFESALLDGIMQLEQNPEKSILVGGVDEITSVSHEIQNRFGIFKSSFPNSLDLLKIDGAGTVNGEGAAFFVLSGKRDKNTSARIQASATFYKPGANQLQKQVREFLSSHLVDVDSIDLVLMGKSGDQADDQLLNDLVSKQFPSASQAAFKHLCGEYPVASAFAVWLASSMLKNNAVPSIVMQNDKGRPVRTILVFNQYFGRYYSVIVLSHAE
jgi:3-oxoacyl-(acyl-carrier-protein) synthase